MGINNIKWVDADGQVLERRGRDLNSRYRFTPYGGLANRWFQPLTHLSVSSCLKIIRKKCTNFLFELQLSPTFGHD